MFVFIKFPLHWRVFPVVQMTASQHQFRCWRRRAVKPYLNQCWPRRMTPSGLHELTEICLYGNIKYWCILSVSESPSLLVLHHNGSIVQTNIHKRHPIARPIGRGMGVFCGSSNWLVFCASVPVIIHVIFDNIGPRYNGTRLYYFRTEDICLHHTTAVFY